MKPFAGPPKPWLPGHRGVDLAGSPGTPVAAAADGTVAFVGRVVDRDVVSIDHAGGYRTTYEPVQAVVARGARVTAGQLIGHVQTGAECSSGCLHWGLRQGRDYLDPMAWLSATGVRLLPLDARPRPLVLPPAPPSASGPLPPASAGLARPAPGPVTSPCGMRLHPVLHVWKLHDGMDFGASCGTPVRSSAAGRVVAVQAVLGYGNRVVVEHGTIGGHATRTSYNHLSGFSVRTGQSVAQGQTVGTVGSTGFSTGCHLHYMVWQDGRVTDPARFAR